MTMTEFQNEEHRRTVHDRNDLNMMRHPAWWPQLFLFIKKRNPEGGLPTCAWLKEDDGQYSYTLSPMTELETKGKTDWKGTTPEDLVANGWIVD